MRGLLTRLEQIGGECWNVERRSSSSSFCPPQITALKPSSPPQPVCLPDHSVALGDVLPLRTRHPLTTSPLVLVGWRHQPRGADVRSGLLLDRLVASCLAWSASRHRASVGCDGVFYFVIDLHIDLLLRRVLFCHRSSHRPPFEQPMSGGGWLERAHFAPPSGEQSVSRDVGMEPGHRSTSVRQVAKSVQWRRR
jgi:hypothetical protein